MVSKILARTGLGRHFWSRYAAIYDTLLTLSPYSQLLVDMAASLRVPRGALILDAGCGSGNLTARLLNDGYQVVGIDSSPGMLARGRQKCPTAHLQEVDLDRALDFADGTFHAVVCSNVLYSLPRPAFTLRELRRVLRPGGQLVLANTRATFSMPEILRQHWRSQGPGGRMRLLTRIPALFLLASFNMVLLSPEQKSRLYFPDAQQLQELLSEVGFEGIQVASVYADQGWLATGQKVAQPAVVSA